MSHVGKPQKYRLNVFIKDVRTESTSKRSEKMKIKKQFVTLIISSIILVTVFAANRRAESSPHGLALNGLVDRPRNFAYSELQNSPMVSEVAPVKCIAGRTEVYNWTGVPLFFLLSKTGIKPEAKEVVFYASDGFSSSLTLEEALHPTIILALKANGTALSDSNGAPYRVVVPCKYGYKWVKEITEIKLVDYDYKGTYEKAGLSDEADIPNCTLPKTTPAFETFNVTANSTTYDIITLTNSTIDSFCFDDLRKQVRFNIRGAAGTTGYFYVVIPKNLLWCDLPEQWQVMTNDMMMGNKQIMDTTNSTRIYFEYAHAVQELKITGVHAMEQPAGNIGDNTVPINKWDLLSPYVALVSTVLAATVLTTISIRRSKQRKEESQTE